MKFTNDELDALRRARKNHPDLSQRALASKVYVDANEYGISFSRTRSSLYGAIRRVEKQVASAVTAGLAAVRQGAVDREPALA